MRRLLLVFAVGIILICTACAKQNEPKLSDMERIQKRLTEMKNYVAVATVEKKSNKGSITYQTKQYYKMTGEYRIEFYEPESVSGCIIVNDNSTISQYNPRLDNKIIEDVKSSSARDELFLGAFLKNYLQSEDVSIAVGSFDNSRCTVLEAVIPGGNSYLASEKLWVDNETLQPVRLVIYGEGSAETAVETIVVTFTEFSYNVKIDESIFTNNFN